MQRRFVFLLSLLTICAGLATANCQLTADNRLIRAEGLAEPVGDITLNCSGVPGQTVRGVLQVSLDSKLGNRLDGNILPEVLLSIRSGSDWIPVGVPARFGMNGPVFEGLALSHDAQGLLALRVSGLRAEAKPDVKAFLAFLATPALPVPTPTVQVAKAEPSLLSGYVNKTVSRLTVRPTEGIASGFGGGPADKKVRLLIRFRNVPKDAGISVPDAVAGSSALVPTSAGHMDKPVANGTWQNDPQGGLLLVRVARANPSGAGGTLVYTPQPGLNELSGSGLAESGPDGPYAVYEVAQSAADLLESAEIPAALAVNTGWQGLAGVIKPEVHLAPLSSTAGPSETLPIPRFIETTQHADCLSLGDCSASYFPHVIAFRNGETQQHFKMSAGSSSPNQYIAVRDNDGPLVEWRAVSRYRNGADWIHLHSKEGIGNATVAFYYDARALTPGVYELDLAVEVLNGPVGIPRERVLPFRLEVTPAVEPPTPEPPKPEPPKPEPTVPRITDVLNAANRIPGPLALGSLAVVLGENFTPDSTVTVNEKPAVIFAQTANEISFVVPDIAGPSDYAPVVVSNPGPATSIFGVSLVPVSPAFFHALNENGGRNDADHPAVTDSNLQLWITGIRHATEITVRIHDREIAEIRRVELDPEVPGVDVLLVRIPADLPAMSSAVNVCVSAQGGGLVCAEPLNIWLRN